MSKCLRKFLQLSASEKLGIKENICGMAHHRRKATPPDFKKLIKSISPVLKSISLCLWLLFKSILR
ncbi:MAG TPA: hypothetical protein DDW68_03365 [Verrucomicrobiales bacterium]|nr:hypothetical protein [Verrucomicrobiales bacterium]HBE96195.1 hypothetical protein [Verrucomicrobiales bacterium]